MKYQPIFDYQFDNINLPLIRQNEKKNLSSIGKACGTAVVAFIVIETIISLILYSSETFVNLYENNSVFNSGFMIVITVFALFGPFCFAYSSLKNKKILGELLFGVPNDKKDTLLLIPIAIMICIIGSIFTSLVSVAVDSFFGIEFTLPEDTSDYQTIQGILVSAFATAVVPAFVEEFAIRGVVMQSLRKYGDKFAIIMSSFVFALMHGNMVQIPFAFIAGIALGYVAIKTNSLWPGIIIHFINNSMAVLSMVALENLSENGSTIFTVALYAVVFLMGITCSMLYIKKNPVVTACLSDGQVYCLKKPEKISSFICNVPMVLAIAILIAETAMYIN